MMINSAAGANDFTQPATHANQQATRIPADQNIAATRPQEAELEIFKPELVQNAVNQIEQFTQSLAQNLKFSIDEETGKMVVRITDAQTQEVIRQIPSKEAINIARAIGEIKGLLFSDQA
jgi:flagellar protein FlaG